MTLDLNLQLSYGGAGPQSGLLPNEPLRTHKEIFFNECISAYQDTSPRPLGETGVRKRHEKK
jgi:hypothetical protein